MTDEISPKKIKEYLDKFVVGQEKAKIDLAILGFYQKMRYEADIKAYDNWIYSEYDKKYPPNDNEYTFVREKNSNGDIIEYHVRIAANRDVSSLMNTRPFHYWLKYEPPELPPNNGLILGPTGCGKTYLIDCLGKALGIPHIYINATELTNTGYVGNTLADLINVQINLLKSTTDFTMDDIRYAIVFIDEFDKICIASQGERHQSWYGTIQRSMLAAFEGKPLNDDSVKTEAVHIATDRFMFILGGSFQHMRDAKLEKSKGMGYTAKVTEDEREPEGYHHKDLEEAGLIRELAGRLSMVTEVFKLTREELRAALKVEANSLDPFKKLFKLTGKELNVTKEQEDEIR